MKASKSTCRCRLVCDGARAKGRKATAGRLRECRWCRSALGARLDKCCGAWFWPPLLHRAQRGHLLRENILSNYTPYFHLSAVAPKPFLTLVNLDVSSMVFFFFFLQVKPSEDCFSFSSLPHPHSE